MWRTVYKLVKQLGDAPDLAEPAKVAGAVKVQLDKFKLLLPLFQCLCNRGLRPRHWAQISEAVGFEIKGEDGTTFRQLLRLKVRGRSGGRIKLIISFKTKQLENVFVTVLLCRGSLVPSQ